MKTSITFNILIKKEEDYFIAHCLELDIVATADTVEEVKEDILSLMKAQIEYAFFNDNMDNLYHSAPQEVWNEFYSCTDGEMDESVIEVSKRKKDTRALNIPNIIATTCLPGASHCYA